VRGPAGKIRVDELAAITPAPGLAETLAGTGSKATGITPRPGSTSTPTMPLLTAGRITC